MSQLIGGTTPPAPEEASPALRLVTAEIESSDETPVGRDYLELAMAVGSALRLMGQYDAKAAQATELIVESERAGETPDTATLIGRLTIEAPLSGKLLDRRRKFLERAYPDENLEEFSDAQIERMAQVLPSVIESNAQVFPGRTRNSLDVHLRRLSKWFAGETNEQIAHTEFVVREGVSGGRTIFARSVGARIGLEQVMEAAKELEAALDPNRHVPVEQEPAKEQPAEESLAEVIINLRDGKFPPAPRETGPPYIRPASIPEYFGAEVATMLNVERGNVHIRDIILRVFGGRRLSESEYFDVKAALYQLGKEGVIVNQGRGFYATYGPEIQDEPAYEEPIEVQAPTPVAEEPAVPAVTKVEDYELSARPAASLKQMLKEAGVHDRTGMKPHQRNRRGKKR